MQTYGSTQPDLLNPRQTERALRVSIVEGMFATVFSTVTTAGFLTGYALLVGASDFDLGLVGALPFLSQVFQVAGAYLIERIGSRRAFTTVTALLGRGVWAFMIVLPHVRAFAPGRLPLFLACFGASQLFTAMASNSWLSWMRDIVPAARRGRFFGLRNTALGLVGMGTNYLAGQALDRFTAAGQQPLGFSWLVGVGVAGGVLSALLLLKQPEPAMPSPKLPRMTELVARPLRDGAFRQVVIALTAWSGAVFIAAPFFSAQALKHLNVGYGLLAILNIVSGAVSLVSLPLLGRLLDRVGSRPVLLASTGVAISYPVMWMFATPDFLFPLWLDAVTSGVFWVAVNQAVLNLLLESVPSEGSGAYFAVHATATGLGTFLSSTLAGIVAGALGSTAWRLGPIQMNNFLTLFLISSGFRMLVVAFLIRRLPGTAVRGRARVGPKSLRTHPPPGTRADSP